MDLQISHQHMFGKSLNVDGTSYKIDETGLLKGASEVDAKQLLAQAGNIWRLVRAPVPPQPPVDNDHVAPGSELFSEATLAAVKAAAEAEAAKADPTAAAALAAAALPPPAAPEPLSDPLPLPDVRSLDDLKKLDPSAWPDPSVEMEIEALHAMADAYEVKYKPNTAKKDLVAKIEKAMYPEGR